MLDPVGWPESGEPDGSGSDELDPGLTGQSDRPVPGIDNGFVAGYRVRFDEAGPDGRIRTSALLRYAQDAAWRPPHPPGLHPPRHPPPGPPRGGRAGDLEVAGP